MKNRSFQTISGYRIEGKKYTLKKQISISMEFFNWIVKHKKSKEGCGVYLERVLMKND